MKRRREHFLANLAVIILGSFSLLSLLFTITSQNEIDFSVSKRNQLLPKIKITKTTSKRFPPVSYQNAKLVEMTGEEMQNRWTATVAEAKKQLLGLNVSSTRRKNIATF